MHAAPLHQAWFPVLLCLGLSAPCIAAGRVELVLSGENQLAADYHQWIRVLSQAGVENVRIRSSQTTPSPQVEVQGTAERPLYVVTGILTARGELILPGARFQRSDGAAIARWISDLADKGPPERREPRGAFGLTAGQREALLRDLSQPSGILTQGKPRLQAIQDVAGRLQTRISLAPAERQAVGDDRVAEELSELSCGTVLACLLRPAGLALVPQSPGDQLFCAILTAEQAGHAWPIGWPLEKPAREILPVLFEFLNVEIRDVTADKAIGAIQKRVKVPFLLDHNALAQHGIDPSKVTVALPNGRSTYSLILHKILFQARLKDELRVDEAGKPFLWVSTIKPVKP